MSRKDDRIYDRDVLRAIEKTQRYIQGVTEPQFRTNELLQDGVIRQLEIAGEAAKRLSPEFRDRYSDIPWSKMARLRDYLIHRYSDVDLSIIWKTITQDLPPLIAKLREILNREFGDHYR